MGRRRYQRVEKNRSEGIFGDGLLKGEVKSSNEGSWWITKLIKKEEKVKIKFLCTMYRIYLSIDRMLLNL